LVSGQQTTSLYRRLGSYNTDDRVAIAVRNQWCYNS